MDESTRWFNDDEENVLSAGRGTALSWIYIYYDDSNLIRRENEVGQHGQAQRHDTPKTGGKWTGLSADRKSVPGEIIISIFLIYIKVTFQEKNFTRWLAR